MQPTQQLKDEHEGIKVALAVLDRICDRLEEGGEADAQDLKGIVEFLQVFADRCHHGKEEGLLFPALEQAGIPKEGGPVGVMLAEHDQGRGYIKGLQQAVDRYAAGDRAAAAEIVDNGRRYSALLARHIEKENNVLFPMADRALSQQKANEFLQACEVLETEKIGAGRHEAFHAFLEELEKKYLQPSRR